MKHNNHYNINLATRQLAAFSLLELLSVLVIMAMIAVVVLQLLHRIDEQTRFLHQEMTQRLAIQHSLNQLIEDIAAGADNNMKLNVEYGSFGGHDTAHLMIKSGSSAKNRNPINRIDWIGAPRHLDDGNTDLVLFRRARTGKEKSLYIPLCENLYSFQVEFLDDQGQVITKDSPEMIVATAQVYRSDRDPDRLLTVSRTFCLERF